MKAKILTIILLFLLVASNASALIAANFIDKNNNQVGVLIVEKGETAVFETTLYSALGKGHENINILLVNVEGNVIKKILENQQTSRSEYFKLEINTNDLEEGEYDLWIDATDKSGDGVREETKILTLIVRDPSKNTPPVFTLPQEYTFEVNEGQLLEIQFDVFDSDPVVMELQTPAEGANFYVETNKAKLMWTPDFNVVQHPETEKTFAFTVSATDASGARADKTVNVRVIDINRNPVLSVSPENIEELAGKTIELTVIASDADNDQITVTVDNSNFEVIDNKYIWRTKLSDAGINPYIVTFTASDNFEGAAYASSMIKLTSAVSENQFPVASFTYPSEAFIGEEVTFDASSSFDQDGEIIKYEWETGDGNTLFEKIITHIYTAIGQFTIKLVVTDDNGATSTTIEQIINIIARTGENQAPVANAGPDQTVKIGTTVTLDGSASSDPDREELSYSWTQLAGNTVSLTDSTTKSPIFTANELGTYIFELIVTDEAGLQSTPDTVSIEVVEEIIIPPIEKEAADIHKFTISSAYVREQDDILMVFAKIRNRGNNQETVEITATILPTGQSFTKRTVLGMKENGYEVFYLNKPEDTESSIVKLEVSNRRDSDVYYLPLEV